MNSRAHYFDGGGHHSQEFGLKERRIREGRERECCLACVREHQYSKKEKGA